MTDRLDGAQLRQPVVLVLVALALAFFVYELAVRGFLLALPALAIAGVVGLALARYPLLGYALLIMSVPFQRLGSEGTALPVTLTQLMFPVAVAGFFIAYTTGDRKLRGHVTLVPFVASILVLVVSTAGSASVNAGMAEIARWLVALAAFWLGLQIVVGASQRRIIAVVALLAGGGVFEATVGVVQSVIGVGPFQVSSGVSRAFGTFGRPNSYAGYLEMTLFPAVAMAIWFAGEALRRYRVFSVKRLRGMAASREARRRFICSLLAFVFFAGSAAITLSGIIASLSRGAWFGVGIAGVIFALLFGRVSRMLVMIGLVGLVALMAGGLAGVVPENYRERITESIEQVRPFDVSNVTITNENFAAAERVAHWQSGWNMYRDHPALGVGAGNYNVRFEEYSVRQTFRTSQGHAHNYYIHTLAETGLVGLLVYLTLLGSILFLGLRVVLGRQNADNFSRLLVLGALGSTIAVSAHNVFENLHVLNLGIVIGLLWILVIAGHERWRHALLTEG